MKLLRYMTLYDKILIILVIIISITAIVFPVLRYYYVHNNDMKTYIVIQAGNDIIEKIDIKKTYSDKPIYREVKGPLGLSIIEAHEGKVRMYKAPEKDPLKICEKTGWISEEGPRIICVPNKVTIWIEEENGIDGITE